MKALRLRTRRKLARRFIARVVTLGALFAVAIMNNACSTPDIPYTNPTPPDTAFYAYQQCLAALPRTANQSACDNVGNSNAQSSYYYTGAADTGSIGWPQGGLNGLGFPSMQTGTGPYTQPSNGTGFRGGYKAIRPAAPSNPQALYDLSYHEYLRTLDEATLRDLTSQWLALAASAR